MAPDDLDRTLPSRLLAEAVHRLASHGASLPSPLDALFRETWSEWLAFQGAAGPAKLFLSPLGTPAFSLLASVACFLPDPEGEEAQTAAEAMLTQYLAVRVQDDLVDEARPVVRSWLVHALLARVGHLLARVSDHPAEMAAAIATLDADFAAAALSDHRLRTAPDPIWTDAAIRLQGRKYLPMLAPVVAILLRAERADVVAPLRVAMERLCTAFQLTNDLLGPDRDLASGQRSPLLSALRLHPGLHGREDVDPAIRRYLPAFHACCDLVATALDEGAALLPPLASLHFHRHLEERRAAFARFHGAASVQAVLLARPVALDLEVTQRCNLSCAACFVHQQQAGSPDAELPVPLIQEILEELSGYRATLHLTGGEPFLHPAIWSILAMAASWDVRDVVINTNGTLLDAASLRQLAGLGLRVRLLVSVDGPWGTQERSRGPGTTARALAVLRDAPALGIQAEPAVILTRELLSSGIRPFYEAICDQVGHTPPLTLWCLYLPGGGLAAAEAAPPPVGTRLTAEDLPAAADQVAAMVNVGLDVAVADFPLLNPLLRERGVPDERLVPCEGGRSRLCVQADGAVTPCHPLRTPLDHLGPGTVSGFIRRAFHHPDAVRMASRSHPPCDTCLHAALCGGCRAIDVADGPSPRHPPLPCPGGVG